MTVDFTRWGLGWRRLTRGANTEGCPGEHSDGPIIGWTDTGAPVTWPRPAPERAGHVVCFASSGAGKTVMIASGIVGELAAACREPVPLALVVIDAKGDLIQAVLQGLVAVAPARLTDVRYLDPFSSGGGFAFNLNRLALGNTPIDIRAHQIAALCADASTARGAQKHLGVGARQIDVLEHVVLGALTTQHPAANVLWALDALVLPKGMAALAALSTSARARQFLSTATLSDELRASCASRLRSALAASENLERLVAADGCVQFGDLLAPSRICLVDLGRPTGGLSSLQAFYANLIGRLAIEHLMERPSPWTGHHCRIVIDEAQVVAAALAERAESLLTTGRSRGVSLSVISQGTCLIHQASDTLLRVLMTNTRLKLIGRLSAPDAELLGREQAPGRGVEETLSAVRGRFTAAVTNLEDREFFQLLPGQRTRFRSADVDLALWERTAEQHGPAIVLAKNRLALPASPGPRVTLADVAPPPRGRRPRGPTPHEPPATSPEDPNPPPRKPRSRWG